MLQQKWLLDSGSRQAAPEPNILKSIWLCHHGPSVEKNMRASGQPFKYNDGICTPIILLQLNLHLHWNYIPQENQRTANRTIRNMKGFWELEM